MNSINTNIEAINAASALNGHYSRISTSMERLSSGLRINSAADDAAGLAIRELMRCDVAAINQGMRNANDAISMLQVADSALAIIDEKLIRMKELAEQAATGTYNSIQRLMIDSEFQAMGAEIDRIANATDFNGIKLLDGSLSGAHNGSGLNSTGKLKIHFGPGNDCAEDYYYVDIGACTVSSLGLGAPTVITSTTTVSKAYNWLNEATIDTTGMTLILDISDRIAGANGMVDFVTGMDFYALPTGLRNVTITTNTTVRHPAHKPHVCLFTTSGKQLTGPSITGMWNPVVNGAGVTEQWECKAWWNDITPWDFINKGIDEGIFLPGSIYDDSSNSVLPGSYSHGITQVTGQNEIGSNFSHTAITAGNARDEIIKIDELTDELAFFMGGHDNPGGGCNRYKLRIEAEITDEFLDRLDELKGANVNTTTTVIEGSLRIDTQDKAQRALVNVDRAIVSKDKIRAHLGALQNRLENTVANLSIQGENLQAAESRISDADIAREMTAFVRSQILSQSTVAMLGQANSFPHMLMQLLSK